MLKTLQTLSRGTGAYHENASDWESPDDGMKVSEAGYWETYYNHLDFSYEWKNGYLEAKPMADVKSAEMHRWFCTVLDCYLAASRCGVAVSLEIGFRMDISGVTSVRKPDLAVVLNDNRTAISADDATYHGIFDLCIECLSYSSKREIERDVKYKKGEYGGAGVTEYYILDARRKETAFYRLDKNGRYRKIRPAKGGIVRSRVLPGFQFRISDLYRQPSLEEMAEDEVYNAYVFPSYKVIRKRAEEAEKSLNLEKQRAELLAAKLMELGIDPDRI
ncbi:MAG: Uma2 family endonuclease [Desulfobacterales bacterium]|nr:Uma2 family endonuclease [Desulfobacterales bacterium]